MKGLSHVIGFGVFLLTATGLMRLFLLTVVLGGGIVWLTSKALPHHDLALIVTSHSVGISLLVVSSIIALGVVGRLMVAWNQV